ncbi:MAG: hypothetical protein WAK33_00365, partial [Silvibacterium sp.]
YSLRHSIKELVVQQRIAELRSQLAQEQLETIQAQLKNGSGSPNAPPVSPKDEQQALIQERERYVDALDATFSMIRVELTLMRSLGRIEDWVRGAAAK